LQREWLFKELQKIKSIIAFDTQANFVLLKLLKGNEEESFEFFIKKGIMIRKAGSFEGLDKSFIRIAIKSFADNEYLIKCFKEY
jgi:threonine-phosphate decarboxylase